MNLGIRMFAFIQQRDTMIIRRMVIRRETLTATRYECIACPMGMGGIYVRSTDKTPQECFCLECGQLYLVVITRVIE